MQSKKDLERIEKEEALMAGWYPGTDSQYWAEYDGEDYADEAPKGGRTATGEGFEHPSEQDFEIYLTAQAQRGNDPVQDADNYANAGAGRETENDGDQQEPPRNKPCPCGSRKKYKKCCGSR